MRMNHEMEKELKRLLAFAAAPEQVPEIYETYITEKNRHLIGFSKKDGLAGCIGIAVFEIGIEICHIAVDPELRRKGIGGQMLAFILKEFNPKRIVAETDAGAVGFYEKLGFKVESLGEKYPGVERYQCEWIG